MRGMSAQHAHGAHHTPRAERGGGRNGAVPPGRWQGRCRRGAADLHPRRARWGVRRRFLCSAWAGVNADTAALRPQVREKHGPEQAANLQLCVAYAVNSLFYSAPTPLQCFAGYSRAHVRSLLDSWQPRLGVPLMRARVTPLACPQRT